MSGEIAAAGDMMAGALTARAVEPRAGEAHGAGHVGALCLNCGTKLIGEHCHRCGQSGHVHRTVGAIGHELAHGVLHFEGKIWRTLPMLAFRPGELTRRYIAGERARFVSPLALFLFSVFLMFAIVASLPGAGLGDVEKAFERADFEQTRARIADERLRTAADVRRKREEIAKERAKPVIDGPRVARLEKDVAELRANDARLAQAQRFLPPPDAEPNVRLNASRGEATSGPKSRPGNFAIQFESSDDWFNAKWRYAKENPKLLLYKVKTSAYKYSWALIPISLPFIWLLFPFRRGVGMYDHAVFATYSLSFMSLFTTLMTTLASLGLDGPFWGLVLAFVPPIHIYKQLKGSYRLRRLGALWRTMWMLMFAFVASIMFVLFLLFMGASG